MRSVPSMPSMPFLLFLPFMPLLLSGCQLDAFLFNARALTTYELPGNTISANLIEEVTFQSEGHTLYGFWVGSNGTRPGITILYSHGNKHHIDEYWDRVMFLHDLGVNLFIYDYRGFGRSEGASSTEAGLLADGRAALQYVLGRPGVEADSVGLYGYSLGSVVAIYLAADVTDPLFLIVEAPFASAASLTQASLNLALPAGWLTKGTFDNAERVKRSRGPFLLFHGEQDDFVRYRDNGRVVYEHAPDPKQRRLVAGAAHDDVPQVMGLEAYRAAIDEWIAFSVER